MSEALFLSSQGTMSEKMCAREEVFLLLTIKDFIHYLPIEKKKQKPKAYDKSAYVENCNGLNKCHRQRSSSCGAGCVSRWLLFAL